MRILLTRPIDQARASAGRLERAGHQVSFAPMLRVEPLAVPPLAAAGIDAIAVTSARAAAGLRANAKFAALASLPVFAVADRTAQAMRAAGFTSVRPAAGHAAALAAMMIAELSPPPATILYPCGRDRRGDLEGQLRAAGFMVRLIEVYAAQKTETLPDAVRDALASSGVDAVLIYSRRTAEAFLRALQAAGIDPTRIPVFAISRAAGEPLATAGSPVTIAETPDERGLFALLPREREPDRGQEQGLRS